MKTALTICQCCTTTALCTFVPTVDNIKVRLCGSCLDRAKNAVIQRAMRQARTETMLTPWGTEVKA